MLFFEAWVRQRLRHLTGALSNKLVKLEEWDIIIINNTHPYSTLISNYYIPTIISHSHIGVCDLSCGCPLWRLFITNSAVNSRRQTVYCCWVLIGMSSDFSSFGFEQSTRISTPQSQSSQPLPLFFSSWILRVLSHTPWVFSTLIGVLISLLRSKHSRSLFSVSRVSRLFVRTILQTPWRVQQLTLGFYYIRIRLFSWCFYWIDQEKPEHCLVPLWLWWITLIRSLCIIFLMQGIVDFKSWCQYMRVHITCIWACVHSDAYWMLCD